MKDCDGVVQTRHINPSNFDPDRMVILQDDLEKCSDFKAK
jgi:hypothetical protein